MSPGSFEAALRSAAEAELSVGAQIEPLAHRGVARTEAHGLLNIGSGLLKTAQIVFAVASERQQRSSVRINGKPRVDGRASHLRAGLNSTGIGLWAMPKNYCFIS